MTGTGCGCPESGGKIYHQAATCTDPVVARLRWYASAGTPARVEIVGLPSLLGTPHETEVPVPAWPCEAYGDAGLQFGAWCFVAAAERHRACEEPTECLVTVAGQRQRIFDRIQELAASGDDPVWPYLAGVFTSPDLIMNPDVPPPPGDAP